MAVEDGAVLGRLLGLYSSTMVSPPSAESTDASTTLIPSLLRLYESLRKSRTTINVRGAVENRVMFHLSDGPQQEKRDAMLEHADWAGRSEWNWLDAPYQKDLLGFDAVGECEAAFDRWKRETVGGEKINGTNGVPQ